jgi:hypothetical protein
VAGSQLDRSSHLDFRRAIYFLSTGQGRFVQRTVERTRGKVHILEAGEIVLGALQVLTCCWLISLVKVRSKMSRVALGVMLGILTALLFPLIPVLIVNSGLWLEPLIGIYVFLFSGIVFGAIAGRPAVQPDPRYGLDVV